MRRRRYAIARAACDPANVIRHSPQTELTRYRDGETSDIIEAIMYMDAHSGDWVVTENIECLRGGSDYETLRNVWRFVKKNLTYRPDRPGHERVKSPGALYTSGTGDCKSFSIAEGALLRALGYPYKYRFAAYERGDFTHVYVVAPLGGREVILDAVKDRFDDEHPYRKKQDRKPAIIAGIGRAQVQPAAQWGKYLILGLFMFLIIK